MTTFPPPPAGHAWHNPDNLTPEQVGDGYRLLLESELSDKRGLISEIHLWLNWRQEWNTSGWFGNQPGNTYRVPLATWPLPSPVEPQPDADEALAIVRALAEWSYKSQNDHELTREDIEILGGEFASLEARARALFPQTNTGTNTP